MSMDSNVLERSVLQAGKTFIKAGEEITRAYVIQDGQIAAFTTNESGKVEVARFGPGTIIGEMGLVIDEASALSYEALTLCTVVTITRPDFQKRLSRTDKTIVTILDHAVKKIQFYENIETQKALKKSEIDDMALALMNNLLQGVSLEKKSHYEEALLPHINGLIKEIKMLKSKQTEQDEQAASN